ncbi:putative cyclin-dependent kinase F-2 [Panicum miliaceum]|uniref:[RNA-polymerase]-subunit kinase n=1 Tax=Panicum miliaceum TaxID=4540 RepID=A0A3L6S598_PANMI|nr:putative cyclin-dependent kinase F-2 [Panicum miliaceum]
MRAKKAARGVAQEHGRRPSPPASPRLSRMKHSGRYVRVLFVDFRLHFSCAHQLFPQAQRGNELPDLGLANMVEEFWSRSNGNHFLPVPSPLPRRDRPASRGGASPSAARSPTRRSAASAEGNFGAVVKARHRGTGRIVAIKRVGEAQGGPAAVLREARFLEEASGGGANPFVVGFHGVVRGPATLDLRLVMSALHDLLCQRATGSPPLPEATVRAAMWQLLTAAKKMHDGRIVHRDIKPQNILVGDGHGVVKLCDFGLAMSTDERPPYEPAGTLWYMAPEMLLEKPDYDERVDIWSLGCVMAELINNGRPLFQGFYDQGQLCAIFDVLGVPDDSTWPGFSSTTFATVMMPELDMQRDSHLREHFPETKLSKEGFEVLRGFLACNPEKRLTARSSIHAQPDYTANEYD